MPAYPANTRAALVPGLVPLAAIAYVAAQTDHYSRPVTGTIESSRLVELSGIAAAKTEGEFWGHNDSGHPAAVFRFNEAGKVLQRVLLPSAVNIDWEAMTAYGDGTLYIGDVGDNARVRSVYTIYKLVEPDGDVQRVDPVLMRRFKYPGGQSRNCEAMFFIGERLYLISKERSPFSQPTITCIGDVDGAAGSNSKRNEAQAANEPLVARTIGKLRLSGLVTDAAYSSERKQLAVLTTSGVLFYRVEQEGDLLGEPTGAIGGYFGQCEAVCFDGKDVIITNEKGAIWRLPAPD